MIYSGLEQCHHRLLGKKEKLDREDVKSIGSTLDERMTELQFVLEIKRRLDLTLSDLAQTLVTHPVS